MVARSLLIFLSLCQQVPATGIALIITSRFVVVAADSKAVDAHSVAQADTCKIHKVGDVFYVANNFVGNSTTGYDLDRTILSIKGKSVADIARMAKILMRHGCSA
jgi:hypothetical protein